MNKSKKTVSWPLPKWDFHSAVFSHRKASPSNQKKMRAEGILTCYSYIKK